MGIEDPVEGDLTVHTIPVMMSIAQPPNFYCPQCETHSQNSVNLHFDGDNSYLNGDYCMTCLAQWISRNVPRLIRE